MLGDGPEKQESSESNQYILTWVPVDDLDKLIYLYPSAVSEIKKLFSKLPQSN